MASPPTVEILTSSGITGNTYQPFISGVQQAEYNNYEFRGGSFIRKAAIANDWNLAVPTKITGSNLSLLPAIEFDTNSNIVAILVAAGPPGTSSAQIWVNDELVQASPFYSDVSTGSNQVFRITFASAVTRRIRVEFSSINGFQWVRVPTPYTISKPSVAPLRVIVLGDSFTQPTGTRGGRLWDGWAARLSQKFRRWDVWSSGAGGTGYRNPGPAGQFKIRDRLQTDCIDFAPNMVIWAPGINDTSSTHYAGDAVYTEAKLCYALVKSALPNCQQVVFGPWWNFAGPTADATAVHEQIRRAATESGLPFIPTLDLPSRFIQANNLQSYHPSTAATGTVTRSGNTVASVAVSNAGTGYQAAPAITFAGGGGTGAAATAVMDGSIQSISLLTGGTGYTSPTVAITGGGGSGATATATVTNGVITEITVTVEGTGYTSQPVVTITDATGTGARAVAGFAFRVASVTVTNAGSGYTTNPTVTFAAPSDTVHPTGFGHGFYAEKAAYEMQKLSA